MKDCQFREIFKSHHFERASIFEAANCEDFLCLEYFSQFPLNFGGCELFHFNRVQISHQTFSKVIHTHENSVECNKKSFFEREQLSRGLWNYFDADDEDSDNS